MYLVKTNSGDKFLNSANEVKSINKNDITPSDEVMDMIDRNKDVYYGQIFRATLMNSNLQISLAKISKELGKSTRKAFKQTHLSKYIK